MFNILRITNFQKAVNLIDLSELDLWQSCDPDLKSGLYA